MTMIYLTDFNYDDVNVQIMGNHTQEHHTMLHAVFMDVLEIEKAEPYILHLYTKMSKAEFTNLLLEKRGFDITIMVDNWMTNSSNMYELNIKMQKWKSYLNWEINNELPFTPCRCGLR